MTNLADELERLATKLDDEPDAARRIYRTAALSLWVENNLPQILSALRAKPAEGEPVAWVDRPALDIPALQREVAGIIVRDVLQEEYDDLVEGYLDEIMRASLRIIRLPGYSVVARAFETNLADALLSGGGE